MARIDKTHSAVGVVRADMAADWAADDFDKPFGVGINGSGRVVKGAGTSGIIGVVIPNKAARKAGKPADIFVLADVLECTGLPAGAKIYAHTATGVLSTSATHVDGTTTVDDTYVGFTVEAERLAVRL